MIFLSIRKLVFIKKTGNNRKWVNEIVFSYINMLYNVDHGGNLIGLSKYDWIAIIYLSDRIHTKGV